MIHFNLMKILYNLFFSLNWNWNTTLDLAVKVKEKSLQVHKINML